MQDGFSAASVLKAATAKAQVWGNGRKGRMQKTLCKLYQPNTAAFFFKSQIYIATGFIH